jgi:hypothetical protein
MPLAMSRPQRLVLIAGLLSSLAAVGATKEYRQGILIDLQRYDTDSGALRSQGSFCLAVSIDNMTYLAHQEGSWRWSYTPAALVVGDPIEVRIAGNNLYLKKPNSGEIKAHIVRRERQGLGKNPMTCATQVQTRD